MTEYKKKNCYYLMPQKDRLMTVKVFVFGRPGSGKSTACYYITGLAWRKNRFVLRISDYEILWQMFLDDTEHKRFSPTEPYRGFDVLDFSVLDASLKEIERRVRKCLRSKKKNELIIIEFARDEYSKAIALFSRDLLEDAYFLFIEADVETCIQRVYERAARPITTDDNFVSDYVLRNYYYKDNRQYIASQLKVEYGVSKPVEIIDNVSSKQEFAEKVLRFAELIFEEEI
jgi:adenylate kinase family enzyme